MEYKNLVSHLKKNQIIAMPTSTVYGFIAILKKENIRKINKIKRRDFKQPLQILINDLSQMEKIWRIDLKQRKFILENIDSQSSFIVPVNSKFSRNYLQQSFNKTVMFRLIENGEVYNLINDAGILFSSSVNFAGEEPINCKREIEKKFNIPVGDEKIGSGNSSKIISLLDNEIKEIR